jgi:hypothetical protein
LQFALLTGVWQVANRAPRQLFHSLGAKGDTLDSYFRAIRKSPSTGMTSPDGMVPMPRPLTDGGVIEFADT